MKFPNPDNSFPVMSLVGWWLFDFAYSISTVIGGIYFTKWFTENLQADSKLLNLLFLVSTFIVILIGKWIGKKIDSDGIRFSIITSSIFSFMAILLLFIGSKLLVVKYLIPLSFILFIIFLVGYQIGRICHNVYLRKVIPEKLQTKMSGYGVAANWAGSVFGILLTIPFVKSNSLQGRENTFLIAAIAFGIIASIALYFLLKSREIITKFVQTTTYKIQLIQSLKVLIKRSFIIYFILYDVMTIVQRNLPSFLSAIFRMSDEIQAYGFLVILVCAMFGGIIAAKKITYVNSNFWLKACSLSLCLAIILVALNNKFLLWSAFVVAGLSYGMLESAIRVNFMATFSRESAGENFGVLAIVERASGIFGPLLWIISFSIFSDKTKSYTLSMLVMATLAFAAFLMLSIFKKNNNTIEL